MTENCKAIVCLVDGCTFREEFGIKDFGASTTRDWVPTISRSGFRNDPCPNTAPKPLLSSDVSGDSDHRQS